MGALVHRLRSAVEQFGCSGREMFSSIAKIGWSPLNRIVSWLRLRVGR
jgi:hypothetical protein